jgi:hypothetical protein
MLVCMREERSAKLAELYEIEKEMRSMEYLL